MEEQLADISERWALLCLFGKSREHPSCGHTMQRTIRGFAIGIDSSETR